MGYECNYEVETIYSVEELYQLLKKNLPFVTKWSDYDGCFQRMIFTSNDGVQITVYEAIRPEVTQRLMGFSPTVTVSFDLARGGHAGFDEGMLNITRTVNWLMNNVEGDAALLPNGDVLVLLRRDGQTWLDTKGDWWRDEDIASLTFPYEWKELQQL